MDTAIGTYSTISIPPRAAPAGDGAIRVEPSPEVAADRPREFADSGLGSRSPDERRTEFDSETGSLIYRLVDVTSGAVVSQTPNDARLRLRAYLDRVEADRESVVLERIA